ncbi:MAG TPA: CYTH domain-containing protein [Clostridia bacterium]|nr:CYTH domain-containing protein [Clostridia bacterium]
MNKSDYEEIEIKFLNIDPQKIESKLKKLGAKKVFEKTYRRRVFDYPDLRMDKKGAWLRLRDEGEVITLAFKQRLGVKDHKGQSNDLGMEEIMVEVSDFEKLAKILGRIGLVEKHYLENKRIRYVLEGIEFDIDFYPLIEPFLEIEANSWSEIERAIGLLGLDPKKKRIFSTTQVYALSGISQEDYQWLTFDKVLKKDRGKNE